MDGRRLWRNSTPGASSAESERERKLEIAVERLHSRSVRERDNAQLTFYALLMALFTLCSLCALGATMVGTDTRLQHRVTEAVGALRGLAGSVHGSGGACVAFRRTLQCSPYGFRDVNRDTHCYETMPAEASGYCQCQGGVVVEKACHNPPSGDEPFVCARQCARAVAEAASAEAMGLLKQPSGPPRTPLESGGLKVAVLILVLNIPANLDRLVHAIRRFDRMGNRDMRYPYLVFDTRACSPQTLEALQRVTHSVECVVIDPNHWKTPPLNGNALRIQIKRHGGQEFLIPRHANRWFAGMVWRADILGAFDYAWRLDLDSFIHCPLPYNPVLKMHQAGQKAGFFVAHTESSKVHTRLTKRFREYLRNTSQIVKWEGVEHEGTKHNAHKACVFTSQTEIVELKWMRTLYAVFFAAMDSAEGFLLEKWTDSMMRMLGVMHMLTPKQVAYFGDIHSSYAGELHVPSEDSDTCPKHAVLPRHHPTPNACITRLNLK